MQHHTSQRKSSCTSVVTLLTVDHSGSVRSVMCFFYTEHNTSKYISTLQYVWLNSAIHFSFMIHIENVSHSMSDQRFALMSEQKSSWAEN